MVERAVDNETIFFPFRSDPYDDVHMAHSWLQLDGKRFCLGRLDGCRFCEGAGNG